MPRVRTHQRSFVGGEIAMSMWGHAEHQKVQTGGETYLNMVPWPQGKMTFRPGFHYVWGAHNFEAASFIRTYAVTADTQYAIGFEHGCFRFYTNGAVILYATSRKVFLVDPGTDGIVFTKPHGFTNGQQIRLVRPSTSTSPTGLNTTTTYYAIVVHALAIQVSTSAGPGSAVDITGAGSGDLYFFAADELPRDYVASKNVTGVDTGAETLTITSHGLTTGDPIEFTVSGGTIVQSTPQIAVGTTYYARVSTSNAIFVHPTEADALAGTNALNITGAGGGTTRVHYAYVQGDLVHYPNAGVYYSQVTSPKDNAPGTASWSIMPFTGEYIVPSPYTTAQLATVSYRQIDDLLLLGHVAHPVRSLRRITDLHWVLEEQEFAPPLDPPTNVAAVATPGEYLACSFNSATPTVFTAPTDHGFADNATPVYVDILTGSLFVSGSGSPAPDGFYIVSTTPTDATFTLKSVNGGQALQSFGVGTANVRFASLDVNTTQTYYVTAVTASGVESVASAAASVTNTLLSPGSYNTITWTAVPGAASYRVYKDVNGLAAFMGDTDNTSFVDDLINPDAGYTPPRVDAQLTGTTYPGVLSFFEQRLVVAAPTAYPRSFWFSNLLTGWTMTYHIPVLDSDRITGELAADRVATIRHIESMANLVILTDTAEFVMTTIDSDAITPTSIRARAVSNIGCSTVRPVIVGDRLVFAAARGGHIFEFVLRSAYEGYKPVDLGLYCPHLFVNHTIIDMAFQRTPVPILWAVRSDGMLLGITYAPDEEVVGWFRVLTEGSFESVCVVTEDGEDRLYAVVKRSISGDDRRYIERLGRFGDLGSLANSFHVDSGATYSGPSTTSITGLDYLEGEDVVVNSNGVKVGPLTVTNGRITLPAATTKAQIGLPYTGTWKSLPAVSAADAAMIHGRTKNPGKASVRIEQSGRFLVGVTADPDEMTPVSTTGTWSTGVESIKLPNDWNEEGQVYIHQPNPFALTVISMSIDHDIGGP